MQNTSQPYPQNPFPDHGYMLKAAKVYAQKGWRVLPLYRITSDNLCTCGQKECCSPGKHPCTKKGVYDATHSRHVIERWWQQMPGANIGIATGNGLLVLNIDRRKNGSLEQLIADWVLPETMTVQTGDGWHLYFTYNSQITLPTNQGRLGNGIDCLAEKSYVVAPPSTHSSGCIYTRLNSIEPAQLPKVLLPLLLDKKQLHMSMFSGNQQAQSAQSLVLNPPVTEQRVNTPKLIHLDELLKMSLPKPSWIVPGILPEGMTLLAGRPEIGKSWLALALALAVANGSPILGQRPTKQGDILYLGLEENIQSMRERTHRLLQEQPAPHTVMWTKEWQQLGGGGLADLEDWLELHPTARMIVIDPLAKVYPTDSPKNDSFMKDYAAITALKIIAERYHIAILMVYHQWSLGSSNTMATLSGFDSIKELTRAMDNCMILRNIAEYDYTELRLLGHEVTEQRLRLHFAERAGWTLQETPGQQATSSE